MSVVQATCFLMLLTMLAGGIVCVVLAMRAAQTIDQRANPPYVMSNEGQTNVLHRQGERPAHIRVKPHGPKARKARSN